jgi:hypothetical protein
MIVNTEKDDLKRAIAKMGGITLDGRDGAGCLWGAMARDAHADRRFNFVPGVGQVFKRVSGLSVDRIALYLVELEYLKTDDLTELEDKLQRVIAGAVLWSEQKSDGYGCDPCHANFEAPDDEEEAEDVRERTAEEQDAFGDIIAFLMGDIDELPVNSDDSDELPPITETSGNSFSAVELDFKHHAYRSAKGGLMKAVQTEWIRKRLARASPESRDTVKRLVIETLEAMERKRGIDLTAEKKAVSDA